MSLPDLSFFRLRAKATIDGTIPRGTTLVMTAPGHVAKLNVHPGELHSGEQHIEMAIWATLPPSPQETELRFGVTAISPQPHQIRVECNKPLQFKVLGPEPVRIVDTSNKKAVSVADNVDLARLAINPQLSGIGDPRIARGLNCQAVWGSSNQGAKTLPLYSESVLEVPIRREQQDFFRTVSFELPIELKPDSTSTSFNGSSSSYVVTKRPPFVRFFLYMCCGVAPASIGVMVFWLFRKFRAVEYGFDARNHKANHV